ncbi:MAG: VanZ family protein [Fibrobacter sp.]|nr:VanZ family protein [Fibrobacter sp.]
MVENKNMTTDEFEKKSGKATIAATTVLFAISLAGIFFAGLWPFNFFPPNKVTWNQKENSLSFRRSSIAFISEIPEEIGSEPGFTIDLKIKPFTRYPGSLPRILSIGRMKEEYLIIGQWKSGIVFRVFDNYLGEYNEVGYGKAFLSKKPVQITLSSGPHGTTIFIDGKAVRSYKKTLMSKHSRLGGTVVLGNSITGDQPWNGDFMHLSIRQGLYTPNTVSDSRNDLLRFDFTTKKQPEYYVSSGRYKDTKLIVPVRFSPPFKKVLTPFWIDFKPDKHYLFDVILNLIGFVPSGFLLGLILVLCKVKTRKALIITLVVLASVSLTIELLQVTLPSRTSQLSDLILNGSGGLIGGVIAIWFAKMIFPFRSKLA